MVSLSEIFQLFSQKLSKLVFAKGVSFFYRTNPQGEPIAYSTYGAMCTEVELDILTGEQQITRLDCLYDCGESMSPLVGMWLESFNFLGQFVATGLYTLA